MNFFELNRILNDVAELQKAFPPEDDFTALIRNCGEGELEAEDLEWITAAGTKPDYQAFLKLLRDREGK